MRCFIHQDREAVGLCIICTKALCPECAVDTGYGLACKGEHEEKVKKLNSLQKVNVEETLKISYKTRYLGPIIYGIAGLLLLFSAVVFSRVQKQPDIFDLSLGSVAIIYAIYRFWVLSKIYSKEKK